MFPCHPMAWDSLLVSTPWSPSWLMSQRTPGGCPVQSCQSKAVRSVYRQGSVSTFIFSRLGWTLRVCWLDPTGKVDFRSHQITLQCGRTILHSHHLWVWVLSAPHLINIHCFQSLQACFGHPDEQVGTSVILPDMEPSHLLTQSIHMCSLARCLFTFFFLCSH